MPWQVQHQERDLDGAHWCKAAMPIQMQYTRAQCLVHRESWAQCHDMLLHQKEGLGKAQSHSSNKADAGACCLDMNVIWTCRPKEGLACTRATFIDACGNGMKSWTWRGIASQAQVGVLIPIVIVVWVRLELWILVGVAGATTYQ